MKKYALVSFLTLSPFAAMADESEPLDNFIVGLSHIEITNDFLGSNSTDINLKGIVGSLGYKFNVSDNFSLIPEVRAGAGINNDNPNYGGVSFENFRAVTDYDIKLNRFLAISLRGQLELNNGTYFFLMPSYIETKFKRSISYSNLLGEHTDSGTFSSSGFAVGGGVGYNFGKVISAELMYEALHDWNGPSLTLKYNF